MWYALDGGKSTLIPPLCILLTFRDDLFMGRRVGHVLSQTARAHWRILDEPGRLIGRKGLKPPTGARDFS